MADDSDGLALQLIGRTERMRSARSNFNILFQMVRDHVIPTLARFVGQDPDGVTQNQQTLDETPEQAHEMLAAAIQGMMCNPAMKWADFATPNEDVNEDDECAAWLAHARDRTFSIMYAPRAGLTGAHHETFLDLTSFGTGILFSGEKPGQGLRFGCRPLQECYVAESESEHVDTVHRWFSKTARQAVEKWRDKAPAHLQEKARDPKRQDDKHEFLHAVFPRSDRAFGRFGGVNLPIASVYVDVSSRCTISNSGYHEMPYAVPRWYTRAGEIYGRGPGIKALPSCKALQRTMKITLSGAELAIRPPLQVADDGVFGHPRLQQAALTFVRAEMLGRPQPPISPILTGANPQLGDEFMTKMRQRIEASFYNHLIQMMRDPRMTATQVIQIAEETLRQMGPTIGRIQDEMLGPHIERVFGVLLRAGAFKPPPPKLHGQQIIVQYVSPVAQAQKLAEAKGIVQTFGVAAQLAQTNPDVWDNFDVDGSARALGVMFGMPRYLIEDPEVVAKKRAARAQQNQQQQAVEAAPMMANAVKNAAQGMQALGLGFGDQPQQAAA